MTGRPPERPEDRRLSPSEVRAYLDAPLSDAEREGVRELVRWFLRRYPSPIERLAYVRSAYARWQRTHGLAVRSRGDRQAPQELEPHRRRGTGC